MIQVLTLIGAFIAATILPCQTSWIEYDHDGAMFVAVCGDEDGQALTPIVQNHALVLDVK